MATINFKVGDTFELLGQLVIDQTSGTPIDISGYGIRSQVRHDGRLIQSLTTAITDAVNGRYKISATPVQTVLWPVAVCSVDVEFTTGTGKVMSTETINLVCEQDITI